MSGLAGIYQLDGKPVSPSLLQRMVKRIAHRGPDASHCRIHRSIGMGHAMLHTTPESLEEQQPWQDETGTLCLTLDGRIDNREELTGALEAAGFHFRNNTDAELMLRAYQCWGEACPEHAIGDFALAVWTGQADSCSARETSSASSRFITVCRRTPSAGLLKFLPSSTTRQFPAVRMKP